MGENTTTEPKKGKRAATDIKLYELPAEFEEIHDMLVESEGELTPEIEERLAGLQEDVKTKGASYVAVMRRLKVEAASADALAKSIKQEAEHHAKIAKARANAAERLQHRLQDVMEQLGITKIEHPVFPVTVVSNSRPSFKWTGDADLIPVRLRKTPTLDDESVMDLWKTCRSLISENATLAQAAAERELTPEETARAQYLLEELNRLWPEHLEAVTGKHLRY